MTKSSVRIKQVKRIKEEKVGISFESGGGESGADEICSKSSLFK